MVGVRVSVVSPTALQQCGYAVIGAHYGKNIYTSQYMLIAAAVLPNEH
jgi:hypothetical protein